MNPATAAPQPARDDDGRGDLALVLPGGGARSAYQVGAVRCLARHLPGLRFPIITGSSGGALSAVFYAAHPGSLAAAAAELAGIWRALRVEDVFRVDVPTLARHLVSWATHLVSGGGALAPDVRGFVDTRPLRDTIERGAATVDGELIGITRNLRRGALKAVALITLNYSTGQTVTWVQGADLKPWDQPQRRSFNTRLTVDHVMASAALPLFFPAVRLGDEWYGDGGVRMLTPLGPALRLGATRILAISPQHEPSEEEAGRPRLAGYPPPAQILGNLLQAVFLDALDEDVRRLTMMNPLLERLPPAERGDLKPVAIEVLRPSADLGALAAAYEPRLPHAFRYLMRSLGTREASSSTSLSLLMFQGDYIEKLMELGERDALAKLPEIAELVGIEPRLETEG
jgi:NTE family protein